ARATLERARERLAAWGSGPCRPLTRLLLALLGQVPHDDWTALPANSPLEEAALQIVDARRPVRPTPLDPVLPPLFRDELRRSAGSLWNPLRQWNARQAGQRLQQWLTSPDTSDADGPTSILPLVALHCLGCDDSSAAVRAAWRTLD